MANFTHTVAQIVTGGSRVLQASNAYSEDGRASISPPIASDANDFEVDFVLDVSEIASIIIMADQDMLLEVNDAAGVGGSITLKAGKPYIWNTDSYDTCKLAVDVTALFVTAQSDPATAGTLEIDVVYHTTPP